MICILTSAAKCKGVWAYSPVTSVPQIESHISISARLPFLIDIKIFSFGTKPNFFSNFKEN